MVDNLLFGRDSGFADSDSFIGMGLLDSTSVLELVMFVETTWGIEVEDGELVPENMDSIDSLAAFIRRKQAA